MIGRGTEDWDMDEATDPISRALEISIGYSAAVGMSAVESDVHLSERVSF